MLEIYLRIYVSDFIQLNVGI